MYNNVISFVFAKCSSSQLKYIKHINTAAHKSRCNLNDNAISAKLLEHFLYNLVFSCLICLFLFNGVLLREETSNTNPCALTVIQLSIRQCKIESRH